MKTKQIISLLLSVVMILGMLSGCGNNQPETTDPTQDTTPSQTQPTETQPTEPSAEDRINSLDLPDLWKQELLYAQALGFSMDKVENESISGRELAQMLDEFVAWADSTKLEQWQAMLPKLRSYDGDLQRFDAMGALFLAAQTLGGGWAEFKVGPSAAMERLQFPWDRYYFTEGLFGEHDAPLYTVPGFGDSNYLDGASLPFNLSRPSYFSGEFPFPYDPVENTIYDLVNPSYADCLLAVVRLITSEQPERLEYVPSAEEQAILDNAEARKTTILNTESDWTVGEGGTVYYVSPDGDDANDGLSPETAWKSLGKINSAAVGELLQYYEQIDTKKFPHYQWAADHPDEWITLNPGDVVLFERGGIWRGGLMTAEGVTYSAYGEGAKPEIWGSPENGSGAEKWSLLEGTDNIWVYYKEMQDCGGILLDGETVATKYAPFWDADAGKWLDFGDREALLKEEVAACPEFDVTTLDDLRFFNELQNITPEFPAWCWGKLYLRCDAGNPGEVYDSIEFFTGVDAWGRYTKVAENATMDNLSFKYCGHGMMMNDGATIRNCSVVYCGGIVQAYTKAISKTTDFGEWNVVRTGDCVCAGASDTTVENCYIAYAHDFGLTVENFVDEWLSDPTKDYAHRNVKISGNILEYNGGGLLTVTWDAVFAGLDIQLYDDVYFTDNFVMYTGMGWSHANHYLDGYSYLSAAVVEVNPGNSGEIHYVDNVFYDCWDLGQLVEYQYFNGDNTGVEFRNNTYVANLGARVAEIESSVVQDGNAEGSLLHIYANAFSAESLAESIGDTEANVIIKQQVYAPLE